MKMAPALDYSAIDIFQASAHSARSRLYCNENILLGHLSEQVAPFTPLAAHLDSKSIIKRQDEPQVNRARCYTVANHAATLAQRGR